MEKGLVIRSTGAFYTVQMEAGNFVECRMVGKFRLNGMKLTNPVAVGDQVMIELEQDEQKGLIKKILSRRNYVVRQSPRKKHFLHLIASNVDQAILLVSIKQPSLKWGFIDRVLLMTEPHNIPVVIIVNKSDLLEEADLETYEYLKSVYENIGYKVHLVSAIKGDGVGEMISILKDKTSLICGQSGVGKSTLVNSIEKNIDLKTGDISDYTGKGMHTTTYAEMFELSFGGQIIDTPGIKTLGFNNLNGQDVAHNFKEFFILSQDCKFGNCTHRNEPKCAVKLALENGEIAETRYSNYLSILQGIEDQNSWELHKDM